MAGSYLCHSRPRAVGAWPVPKHNVAVLGVHGGSHVCAEPVRQTPGILSVPRYSLAERFSSNILWELDPTCQTGPLKFKIHKIQFCLSPVCSFYVCKETLSSLKNGLIHSWPHFCFLSLKSEVPQAEALYVEFNPCVLNLGFSIFNHDLLQYQRTERTHTVCGAGR